MPCDNVTELIRVVLDSEDRLVHYRLLKITCGGTVGAGSMLLERLRGRAVEELLALGADAIAGDNPASSEVEEFLSLKHLFALRSVLEAYAGKAPAGRESACAIAGISYHDGRVTIDAEIAVDVVTDQIRACGRCAGGSKL